jgi:uncharacterized protein YjdB
MKSIINKMNTGKWRIFNYLTALSILIGVCASCNEDEEGGVRELVLNQTELGIVRDSEDVLIATAVPFKAKTGIKWTSSDESIATVIDGTVQAKALGKVIISAISTVNPNIKATCEVTVGPVLVREIELNFSGGILYVDSIKTIGAVIKPSNVDDATLVWTSSDEKVVSVDQQGTIKGIAPGESDISIASADGAYSSTIHLIVETYIPVTSIRTDHTLTVYEGIMKQIVATVEPSNASRPALTWTSSSPDVARVDSTGILEGIREGTTIITITTADQVNATINVQVSPVPPPDIQTNGYAGAKIEALFEDGTKKTYELEYELGFYLDAGDRGKIIRTIMLENGTELLIGRSVQTQLRMMFDGYVFVFRNADDDGLIPIGTIAEFDAIRNSAAGSYKLTSDLDFNNGVGMIGDTWEPMTFNGVFDGGGHQLKNVRIVGGSPVALFGRLDGGTVKNLHIASGSIEGSGDVVASFAGNFLNGSIISGCSNNANVTGASMRIGGIVGVMANSSISQTYNTGTVRSTLAVSTNGRVGGVVAVIDPAGSLTECYNTGDVITSFDRVGGVIGQITRTTVATGNFIACYNTGNVSGNIIVGGFVGEANGSPATYTECYNTGSVTITGDIRNSGWFGGRHGTGAPSSVTECFYSQANSSADITRIWGTTAQPVAEVNLVKNFSDAWPGWLLKSSGGHWKTLGNRDSETYPQLWYE